MLAALAEPADPALDGALGAQRAGELRDTLGAIAGGWAVDAAAPGLGFASTRVPGALVEGAVAFDEPEGAGLAEVLAAAFGDHDGPILLVAPDVPRLDQPLAADALGDLAAGCALAFAPATDARPFLLALARPDPTLLRLVAARDRRRDEVLAAALELGGEVGLLRSERRVVSPGDARALVLDPLAPPALRALLR